MPDISKILLPNGTTYSIKDELAREQIMLVPFSLNYINNEYTVSTSVSITDIIDANEENKHIIAVLDTNESQFEIVEVYASLSSIVGNDYYKIVIFTFLVEEEIVTIHGTSILDGSTWNDNWQIETRKFNSVHYIEWQED